MALRKRDLFGPNVNTPLKTHFYIAMKDALSLISPSVNTPLKGY